MAKKKKRSVKKVQKRPAKKRAAAKKKTKRKQSTSRAATPRSAGGTSVDSLLKRFAKERATQETQLETLRKKKGEVEDKAKKLREQIEKLGEQEKKALETHGTAKVDLVRDILVIEIG